VSPLAIRYAYRVPHSEYRGNVAGSSIERIRELSRILFGQQLRLEVMIAVARSDGLVNLTDLAAAVGVQNSSSIQKPVNDLKAAGLLGDDGGTDDSKRRWLRRADSLVWQWVIELAAEHSYEGPFSTYRPDRQE